MFKDETRKLFLSKLHIILPSIIFTDFLITVTVYLTYPDIFFSHEANTAWVMLIREKQWGHIYADILFLIIGTSLFFKHMGEQLNRSKMAKLRGFIAVTLFIGCIAYIFIAHLRWIHFMVIQGYWI